METNGRIEEVDIMRGIGIFLVIIGHMGINSAIFRFIYAFHMPLFFFISGITYKEKRIVDNLKSLILPYAVGGLVTLAVYATCNRYNWPDIMNDLRGLIGGCSADSFYFAPNPALWFLPCMVILRFIDKAAKNAGGGGDILTIAICLCGGILLYQRPTLMAFWGIDIALFEYGFFSLGRIYGKKSIAFVSRECGEIRKIVIALFFCVMIITLSIVNGPINIFRGNYGHSMCLYYLEGMLGIVVVMIVSSMIHLHGWRIIESLLKWCGRHTMPVLLTHQTILIIASKYLNGATGYIIEIVMIALVWYVYVRIQEKIILNNLQKRY